MNNYRYDNILTVFILFRFQLFHSKTGVTGPYTFGVGLATYLFSKEIYVMEHEYYTGLSLLLMVYVATTKLGPSVSQWLDKEIDVRFIYFTLPGVLRVRPGSFVSCAVVCRLKRLITSEFRLNRVALVRVGEVWSYQLRQCTQLFF